MSNSDSQAELYIHRLNNFLIKYRKEGLKVDHEYIIKSLWNEPKKTYQNISSSDYAKQTLQNSASDLWKLLGQITNSRVNKQNFRSTIQSYFCEPIESESEVGYRLGIKKQLKIHEILKQWKLEKEHIYSAPASIFLGGEHSVVYGHPSIYLPIAPRLYIGIKRSYESSALTIKNYKIPDPNHIDRVLDIENIDVYGRSSVVEHRELLDELFFEVIYPCLIEETGFIIDVVSEFPLAIGLNSSGAFSVSLAQIFFDNYLDKEKFEKQLKIKSSEKLILSFAWSIGNCFHKFCSSGAGIHASFYGRKGRYPLIYSTSKRSSLEHRIKSGDYLVNIKSIEKSIQYLSTIETFIFDPSKQETASGFYPEPPNYNLTLLYSGSPSKTGTVLSDKGERKFSLKLFDRVQTIQNNLNKRLEQKRLQSSLQFYSQELIEKIYLDDKLSQKDKDIQLLNAYKELIADSLGGINISMLNSILSDWMFVPELMNSCQTLLSAMGVSDSKTDCFNSILKSIVLKSQLREGDKKTVMLGSKLTGAGKGGDIVVFSLCTPELHVNFIERSREDLAKSLDLHMPVHFHFTSSRGENESVDGVRKEFSASC